MQAKKRAKAVKFGKKIDKPEPKIEPETKLHQTEEKKEETLPAPPTHTPHPTPEEPKIEEQTPEEPQTPPEEIQNNNHQPHEEPLLNSTANETPTLTEDKNETNQINELNKSPEEPPILETQTIHHSSSKGGYFMLIAIISFVIGLLAMAGINFYMQKMQDNKKQEITMKASLTPKPSPTNAPTPTPEIIDLTQYNIKILNGSGVTGAASKLKASLTEKGFTVTSTGNASNNNYESTTIAAKKDTNPQYLEKLKSFLGQSYTLATDSAETPDQPTGTTDVTIIIGSK